MGEAEDKRRRIEDSTVVVDFPAVIRSRVAGRDVTEIGRVVAISDETLMVEVADPAAALALSLSPSVEVDMDTSIEIETIPTVPGSRSDDNPTSRRVELVRRD